MDNESENGKKAPDVEQLAGETNPAEPDRRAELVEQYAAAVEQQAGEVLDDAQLAELVERVEPCGLDAPHGRHRYAADVRGAWGDVWCAGVAAPVVEDLGTYAGMFAQYLEDQNLWIGKAQQPLVFNIRNLCQRLDAEQAGSASFESADLQAVSRLDRQRPGNQAAGVAGDPKGAGQGSIFDELD